MIYIQLAAAFIAAAFAFQNEVPVRKMRDHGASTAEENQFHRWNFVVQFAFAVALASGLKTGVAAYLGFILWIGLVQWLVFDIVGNLLADKAWHYIGETAQTDRILRLGYTWYPPEWISERLFVERITLPGLGRHAGKYKAAFCVVALTVCNLFYFNIL